MNTVDWVIAVFTFALAIRGYQRGFIVGAVALVGFGGGAILGAHVGPLVLSQGKRSQYAPLFALGGALLAGGALASVLETVARHARGMLVIPGTKQLDGLLGGVLTVGIALGLVWVAGTALMQNVSAGPLRSELQTSTILRRLDEILPPSGQVLGVLARIDPLPSVAGPSANVAAPDPSSVRAPGALAARASIVRVIGDACGLGVEGTGWAAGNDLVVTNAHVVAGEAATAVQPDGIGPELDAHVIVFDPRNDIAILRVPDLGERALTLAAPAAVGTSAAILGYPQDGPFDARPARLGDTQLTMSQNAYGVGPDMRQIMAVRGLVRPGNSGGPVVDAAGQVLATVFAEITDPPNGQPGGFAIPNSVVEQDLAKAARATRDASTDSCAD